MANLLNQLEWGRREGSSAPFSVQGGSMKRSFFVFLLVFMASIGFMIQGGSGVSPSRAWAETVFFATGWEDGQESTLVVVEPLGINPGRGHISCGSPVGRALLGRRKGESVEVETPDGPRRLVVLDVQ